MALKDPESLPRVVDALAAGFISFVEKPIRARWEPPADSEGKNKESDQHEG
jgi:hypothetical protein